MDDRSQLPDRRQFFGLAAAAVVLGSDQAQAQILGRGQPGGQRQQPSQVSALDHCIAKTFLQTIVNDTQQADITWTTQRGQNLTDQSFRQKLDAFAKEAGTISFDLVDFNNNQATGRFDVTMMSSRGQTIRFSYDIANGAFALRDLGELNPENQVIQGRVRAPSGLGWDLFGVIQSRYPDLPVPNYNRFQRFDGFLGYVEKRGGLDGRGQNIYAAVCADSRPVQRAPYPQIPPQQPPYQQPNYGGQKR